MLSGTFDDTRKLTRAFAFSFPQLCDKALVLDMTQIDCFSAERFSRSLKTLLETPKMVPVGVNVSVNTARLGDLGVRVQTKVDISQPAS